MKKWHLVTLWFLCLNTCVFGQKSLLFIKNDSRYATYRIGEEVSFSVAGSKQRITQKIMGFEDSLIIFHTFKLPVNDISALYVDEKTKRWYPLRFKYDEILPILGAEYLIADVIVSRQLRPNTLLISGLLFGGGILARKLIGDRITVKGKRRLVISGNGAGQLGTYK